MDIETTIDKEGFKRVREKEVSISVSKLIDLLRDLVDLIETSNFKDENGHKLKDAGSYFGLRTLMYSAPCRVYKNEFRIVLNDGTSIDTNSDMGLDEMYKQIYLDEDSKLIQIGNTIVNKDNILYIKQK